VWRFDPLFGLLIVAAVNAPYYFQLTKDFGENGPFYMLWEQGFGRLVGREYRNEAGPLFFVHTALWAFFPLLPLCAAEFVHRARARLSPPWPLDGGAARSATRALLFWLLVPFVLISASSYKLPQYLFWLAPPAALLAAHAWTRLAANPLAERWLFSFSMLVALILFGAAAVTAFAFFPRPGVDLVWVAAVGGAMVVAGFVGARRFPEHRALVLCIGSACAFHVFFHGYFHPALTEFAPERELGVAARALAPDEKQIAFVGLRPGNGVAFYARRPAVQLGVEEAVARVRDQGPMLAVTTAPHVQALAARGTHVETLRTLPQFPTSRATLDFLIARRRPASLQTVLLVRIGTPR
jgi:4-amino-4-deoxy-L-arabinose transferase-like glycosyltransferase